MKQSFDHIAIIFNPNSTGDAPSLARELVTQIGENSHIKQSATLTPTEHAGHAQELAYELSSNYKQPLIISVSGDGGYNEVINGAMQAKTKDASRHPVVAVYAAGNANDHSRVMHKGTPLVDLIASASIKPLDLIKLSAKAHNFSLERYAHSYIGLGITPEVAVELNKHELNLYQEIRLVTKTFFRYQPFTVEYKQQRREVDSLIFANINEMAKILKLAEKRNVRDNQFEVIEFSHTGSRLRLLATMIRAALFGIKNPPQFDKYSFQLFNTHPVQLDGEVEKLPRRTHVSISSVAKAVDSIY